MRTNHEPVVRLAGFIVVMVSVAGGYLGYFLGHSRAGQWLSDWAVFYYSFFIFLAGVYLIVTNKWEI